MAIKVWNQLENGAGALDWAGLGVVVAALGIADVEGLVQRLCIIKAHRAPKPDEGE